MIVLDRVSASELRDTDVFCGVPDYALDIIARLCRCEMYAAGEYCARQGAPVDELMVVGSGKVAIEMRIEVQPYTQNVTVTNLGRGSVCAWSAIVEPHTLTASIKCLEPTSIIAIPAAGLQRVLNERPLIEAIVMRNMARIISLRLRESRAQLTNLIAEMIKQGN